MDDDICGAKSRLTRDGWPDSFFRCTLDYGHEDEHTACTGQGRIVARWTSETGAVEVWMPTHAVIGLDL